MNSQEIRTSEIFQTIGTGSHRSVAHNPPLVAFAVNLRVSSVDENARFAAGEVLVNLHRAIVVCDEGADRVDVVSRAVLAVRHRQGLQFGERPLPQAQGVPREQTELFGGEHVARTSHAHAPWAHAFLSYLQRNIHLVNNFIYR